MNCFNSQNPNDALSFRYEGPEDDVQLTEHFRLSEFRSKDGATLVKIHPALLLLLEHIRRYYNKPIIINSGYRSSAHNASVGGASGSQHVRGMAADIVVVGVPANTIQAQCMYLDVGGIGRASTYTHVDVHGRGRRWTY